MAGSFSNLKTTSREGRLLSIEPCNVPLMFPHHDLPIALGLILAIGAIPPDALEAVNWIAEMTAPIERLG